MTNDFADASAQEPRDAEAVYKRLLALSRTLDSAFTIPIINYRVGWDAIIGLIPGIGDGAMTAVSGYIVYRAAQLGVPRHLIMRMLGNIAVEFVLGSVPVLGDVFDATFKANLRNMRLLERHLNMSRPS